MPAHFLGSALHVFDKVADQEFVIVTGTSIINRCPVLFLRQRNNVTDDGFASSKLDLIEVRDLPLKLDSLV